MNYFIAGLFFILSGLCGCSHKPSVSEGDNFQEDQVKQVYVSFEYKDGGSKHYIWIKDNPASDEIHVSSSGIITVKLGVKRKYMMEVER